MMKSKSRLLTEIGFVLIIVAGLVFLKLSGNKSNNDRVLSGDFAIGTFERFNGIGARSGRSYDFYYYDKNGKRNYQNDAKELPSSERRKTIVKGDQFFVIYNQSGANLYFDCQINDSTDFNRYVQKFKEVRK